jgi:hypothetical protein
VRLKAFLTFVVFMTANVAVVAASAQNARAAENDEGKRLAEAESACLAGSYDRGAQMLAELYLATRHPAYLHNQARCYEQNGKYELASLRYREFVSKARALSPKQRADEGLSEERIAKIEGQAAKVEALAEAQRSRRGDNAEHGSDAAASVREGAAAATGGQGSGLRVAGVSAMAAGGAALVTGVVAVLIARNAEQEIVAASNARSEYPHAAYQRGERATSVATIGFVSAPVLVAVGAVMYWMGHSGKDATGSKVAHVGGVKLAPVLGIDRVGGLLSMRF